MQRLGKNKYFKKRIYVCLLVYNVHNLFDNHFFRNPTPPGSSNDWKPATKENRQCMIISDEPRMQNNIYENKVTFWDNFIEKYRQLAVNGVVKDVHEEL